jgi:Cd2+/Zn2+-exporting ATPase
MSGREQVAVGQVFVVLPGKKLALDGRVVNGASDVNQASISGESVPVPKEVGDSVFA